MINVANIQSRLGNSFRITGINNPNEARQLSLLLRAGALIAPIQIVEERTIGPTMGQQNITQGLEACLWGLIASIVFMVVYYKSSALSPPPRWSPTRPDCRHYVAAARRHPDDARHRGNCADTGGRRRCERVNKRAY